MHGLILISLVDQSVVLVTTLLFYLFWFGLVWFGYSHIVPIVFYCIIGISVFVSLFYLNSEL